MNAFRDQKHAFRAAGTKTSCSHETWNVSSFPDFCSSPPVTFTGTGVRTGAGKEAAEQGE
jgi:hypothetical protein